MFKVAVGILSLILSMSSFSQNHPHTDHAFVLLGTKQLHAYHLSKFNSPHEYQVLFELRLTDQAGREVDVAAIKRHHRTELLGILSEDHFLISEFGGPRPRVKFKVKLFKGYVRDRERRVLLEENLDLEVVRVDYFKKISQSVRASKPKAVIIVCDSETDEFFASHLIQGVNENRQNFEEIISLSFYLGSSGENSSSVILGCSPQVQGSVFQLTSRGSPFPSLPFESGDDISGKNPVHGAWSVYVARRLILDLTSVNNL